MAARIGLRIQIVTPAPVGSRAGNRVTAARWARHLRALGHRVRVGTRLGEWRADVLVALHARRSAASVEQFVAAHPDGAVIVALTGTDLYSDLPHSAEARRSLRLATRLVVLQSEALRSIPSRYRSKSRVIVQSVPRMPGREGGRGKQFRVCVLGHLREVKDPFLMAEAARLLPRESQVSVAHLGAAIEGRMASRTRKEMAENPRYRWLGERPRWKAMRLLANCDLLVLTSRLEGGANVLSEAIAASVPVVSTRIPGSIGLLGRNYPGYFAVGNAKRLAQLVRRAEVDAPFYGRLRRWIRGLRPLVEPQRERRAWARLLAELT